VTLIQKKPMKRTSQTKKKRMKKQMQMQKQKEKEKKQKKRLRVLRQAQVPLRQEIKTQELLELPPLKRP